MKTNNKSTTTQGVNVEALLAKKQQISNEAIQSALGKLELKKKEEQETKLLEHLGKVQKNTESAVEALREARRIESEKKAKLKEIAQAEQNFYQDADINAYNKAYNEANKKYGVD